MPRSAECVIRGNAAECVIARNEVTKQSFKRLLRFARNDTVGLYSNDTFNDYSTSKVIVRLKESLG